MTDTIAAADIEPVSHTFASQGLTLHYLDWGNDGAPLLILVHGTRDHARSWDWTARALRDRFHVIAVDLRGHGDSDWSPDRAYLLPYHIVDLANLVDHLGAETVTIVAHSFGGSLSSRYAALFPDRVARLVLVDGLGPTPQNVAAWNETGSVRRLGDWVRQRRDPKLGSSRPIASIEEAVTRMAANNPRLSAAQVRHLAEHGVRLHEDGYRWKFDPLVSVFAPEDFIIDNGEFWREITAPTLICYGEESWTNEKAFKGRTDVFRNHRTVPIAEAGHWPHHDRFDIFIAAVREFV
jgi:pimeloyl-ACP methyl ester carboxylesterase